MPVTSSLTMRFSRKRVLVAAAIACLPLNALRVWAYRVLLGYALPSDARIGLLTLIACDRLESGRGLVIGRQNRFIGPMAVTFGSNVFIGRHNEFACGASAATVAKRDMGYKRRLVMGNDVLVNDRHYFDVYGEISVGAGTWIAGIDSQFWTHGASAMDRDIAVGERSYLGSAVRMAPGTSIGNGCVLGIGSVVVSRHPENEVVLGGFPARVLRAIAPEDERGFIFART